MRPAILCTARMVFQVARTAVAAQDSGENRAEQLSQHLGPSRRGDLIEDEGRGDQSPQPTLLAVRSVAGFVAVDHRLVAKFALQFGARLGDRLAGLLPAALYAAQTEIHAQHPAQHFQNHPARHPANHGQICDQGRQFRPESAAHRRRERGGSDLATIGANGAFTSILRYVRLNLRQFRDLVPLRLASCGGLGAALEPMLAMAALRREYMYDFANFVG
jgi:hypothetical protein